MNRVRRLLALAVTLLSSGCSAVDLVNALVPHSGYKLIANRSYGEGPRRHLDVYVPEPAIQDAPVVLFIYGGNWQTGRKEDYLFVGQALSARGFITVIPDYRLYPETRFPGFIEDGALAVRWVRDHATELGGNPRKLFLMGHSAGAYNVAMLSLDPQWLKTVGMDPRRDIQATVGLAGPYDFLPLRDPTLKIIFGPEDGLAATQPINFVTADDPPMFLAAGTSDKTVDPGNVTRLAARIRGKGGEVQERFYSGITHEELVGAIAAPLRFLAPVLADVTNYMRQHETPQKTDEKQVAQ